MSGSASKPMVWIAAASALTLSGTVVAAQDGAFAFSQGSFAAPRTEEEAPPVAGATAGRAMIGRAQTLGGSIGLGMAAPNPVAETCVLCATPGDAATAISAFTTTLPSRLRPTAPDETSRRSSMAPALLSPNSLLGSTTSNDGGFGDGSFEGQPPASREPGETSDEAPSQQPPAETTEQPPSQKKPDTAEGPPQDDPFGVNEFERAGNEQQKPEVRRQEQAEQPERKPEPEQRAEPEDEVKTGEVDKETRPGGNDDFGTGGDFDDPDTRRTEGQPEPERREARPEPRERAEDQPPPRREQRKQAQQQRQGPRVDPGITAFETRDFGVPANPYLRQQRMHGPTPTTLPGGHVLTTERLARAMVNGERFVLVDVLQSDYTLPNAWGFRAMASGGSFEDRVQYQVANWLAKVTRRNANYPIVIFCSDPMCWMSYNAGLRAVAAGYRNVYWYRGGLRAWQMAGFRMVASGF